MIATGTLERIFSEGWAIDAHELSSVGRRDVHGQYFAEHPNGTDRITAPSLRELHDALTEAGVTGLPEFTAHS